MDRKEEKNLIDRLNCSINNQVPKKATEIFVNNKMKVNSNINKNPEKNESLNYCCDDSKCTKYFDSPVLILKMDTYRFVSKMFTLENRDVEACFKGVSNLTLYFELAKRIENNATFDIEIWWKNLHRNITAKLYKVSYCSDCGDEIVLKFTIANY